jgi:hypothetical protein
MLQIQQVLLALLTFCELGLANGVVVSLAAASAAPAAVVGLIGGCGCPNPSPTPIPDDDRCFQGISSAVYIRSIQSAELQSSITVVHC